MSWASKTDYCGLAIANKLIVKSSNENATGSYMERLGQNGDYAATKPYGDKNASPSCEYLIKADIAATELKVKLGKVTTVDGKRYALQSVKGSTGGGVEPTISATSVRIEDSTTGRDNYFEEIGIAITPDEIMQDVLSSFTLTGNDCEAEKADWDISCNVNNHTVNGDPAASDVSGGHMSVQVTIGQYGATSPTLAAKTGWEISSPLTCEDPDSDMPTWKATLSKPLAKTVAQQS